jgi:predicted Fe-Mo cluster-binding NifX family protein
LKHFWPEDCCINSARGEKRAVKVAIPHYQGQVAPCFESTAAITIFTIRRNKVVEETGFILQSREALDRVRLLRDQGVGTLICGGLRSSIEDLLQASGIQVLSWVSGSVEELLERFTEGRLVPGTGRLSAEDGHAGVSSSTTGKGITRLP